MVPEEEREGKVTRGQTGGWEFILSSLGGSGLGRAAWERARQAREKSRWAVNYTVCVLCGVYVWYMCVCAVWCMCVCGGGCYVCVVCGVHL